MAPGEPRDQVIDLDLLDDNPYPLFRRLHAESPVIYAERLAAWLVVPYEVVAAVLTDAAGFTVEFPDNVLEDTIGHMMLTRDGAEHRRLRDPFAGPFRPRAVEQQAAGLIEDISNDLIDEFAGDHDVDLDSRFSEPLALRTVAAVLGIPVDDFAELREQFRRIGNGFANASHDPDVRATAKDAFAEFAASVLDHLKAMAAESATLVGSVAATSTLTDDEVVSNTAITVFGGLETTAAMLSNTVWALLRHPGQWQRVRTHPELLPNAVEESMRWEAPVQTAVRRATTDTTLGAAHIAAGEAVQCLLGAANRDPAVFPNPDRFDIDRPNANRNLSFARGPHSCIGAALARLEAAVGLRTLFERLPGIELDPVASSKPTGHEFRSPQQLWIRW